MKSNYIYILKNKKEWKQGMLPYMKGTYHIYLNKKKQVKTTYV